MPDFKVIFKEILSRQGNSPKWKDGEFGGIKIIPNTSVGTVGQEFIEKACAALEIPYEYPTNDKAKRASQSPWDIKINGITFELKTASEDTSNSFQFNHIRYHRKYDALLCLAVAPNDLYFNIWSKADVTTEKAGKLVSMEKGANASYKLTKRSNQLLPIEKFETTLKEFIKKFEESNQ